MLFGRRVGRNPCGTCCIGAHHVTVEVNYYPQPLFRPMKGVAWDFYWSGDIIPSDGAALIQEVDEIYSAASLPQPPFTSSAQQPACLLLVMHVTL